MYSSFESTLLTASTHPNGNQDPTYMKKGHIVPLRATFDSVIWFGKGYLHIGYSSHTSLGPTMLTIFHNIATFLHTMFDILPCFRGLPISQVQFYDGWKSSDVYILIILDVIIQFNRSDASTLSPLSLRHMSAI